MFVYFIFYYIASYKGQMGGILECKWNTMLPHFASSSADGSVLLWGI